MSASLQVTIDEDALERVRQKPVKARQCLTTSVREDFAQRFHAEVKALGGTASSLLREIAEQFLAGRPETED